jgi:large subunit ribosomal protein L4
MAQIPVIRMDRSKGEPLELSEQIAEAPFNPFLIKDLVVYHQARMRQGTHAAKTRAQVTGSGRKLYRQKGTGNARAGDIKATQRRGGGIVHGPHPRSHAFAVNKKVRKAAMRSALAEKLRREQMIVVETLEPETFKTKPFAAWLKALGVQEALIVVDEIGVNLARASRNLPGINVVHFSQLNVYNLLAYGTTLITRPALEAIQQRITA